MRSALRSVIAPKWFASSVAKRFSSNLQSSQVSATSTKVASSSGKDLQNEHLQNQSTVKASSADGKDSKEVKQPRKKTMAELDEELKLKLEGRSGEGGASGLEYEDGKASAMKRGVRENMFRLI